MTKPRIAVAGIHIESSTFTPYISTADDFIVTRGEELMDRFYWRDEDWATQIEWIPVLHSRALPGGVVERGAYDAWKAEILEGLAAAGPLDGLFFDIHGAMSVQGMDDAERATTKTYMRAAPHSARAVNRRGMSGRDSNTSVDPAREARQSRHECFLARPGDTQAVPARHQALLVGDAAHVGEIDEVARI